MNKRLKVFLLWCFNGAFLLGTCGTLETVILQFSTKSLLHFAIVGLLWGLTSILIVIGLYDAVSHNKEPEKTPRQILTDMLCDGNIIDCYLATYPAGEPDKITYQPYTFFTENKFSQDELTEIMKAIHQKFVLNKETGYMEVDFRDLNRQLSKHGISHFITIRRYYFDTEVSENNKEIFVCSEKDQ